MPNTKDTLKHYGYPEDTPDKDVGIGLWDKSDALDRLAKLPEMIPYLDGNKKIRVVFDYDPDFPKALLQITGLKDNDCVVHYEAQRMAVKKAIMTPYEQFEAVYKECVSNPYKAADEALGKKIADVEAGIKQQKEDDVRTFFTELTSGFGLDWLKFEQLNLKVTLTCTPKGLLRHRHGQPQRHHSPVL